MSTELGELRFVKVEEIVVDPEKNPRGRVTKEDIAELVASIRADGLGTPVQCTEGDQGLELVAGYRRVAACREAGLEEIPVYVRDSDRRDTHALVENLPGLRKDMSPIAEARAMRRIADAEGLNQQKLAKRIGKSPSFVAERLRLLRLPESVQEVLAEGRPGISTAPALEKIAKVSEEAAARVARLAGEDEAAERQLRDNPPRVLEGLTRMLSEERGTVESEAGHPTPRPPREGELVVLEIGGYRGTDIYDLAIDEGRREELSRRIALLSEGEKRPRPLGQESSVPLGEDDVDALRALGVLLEYGDEDGYYSERYCFDSVAVLDRIELTLTEAEAAAAAERESRLKAAREQAEAGGEEVDEDVDPAELLARKEKEKRAEERAKEKEAQAKARRLNLDLGRRLIKRRARKRTEKRRRELIRALALIVVDAEEHLAGLGPRLIYEAWQEVEQRRLKSGKLGAEKITYLAPREASERLCRDLLAAKGTDDILDVIGDALVGATYGSEEELAMSRRVSGYYGGLRHARRGAVRKAIDDEAKGALPPELAGELKRSRERGYEEPAFVG